MKSETKQNLQDKSIWMRILYMLLFVLAYTAAEFVLGVVVLVQIIITLFTGSNNENLKNFGKQISLYVYDILCFLTFNTEEMPFPFTTWPDESR